MKTAVVWGMMPCKKVFYSLLIQVRFICYQPLCQYCYHLEIIFKFVAASVSLQYWKETIIARRRILLIQPKPVVKKLYAT